MKILNGKYDGDMTIQGEVRLNGMITGSATVSEGALLELTGTVVGNLNIEPGSTVYLHGMVNRDVFNRGGMLTVFGVIQGRLVREAGETEIHSESIIRGGVRSSR